MLVSSTIRCTVTIIRCAHDTPLNNTIIPSNIRNYSMVTDQSDFSIFIYIIIIIIISMHEHLSTKIYLSEINQQQAERHTDRLL